MAGAVEIIGYYRWGETIGWHFLGGQLFLSCGTAIHIRSKGLGCVGVKLARSRVAVNRLAGNDYLELPELIAVGVLPTQVFFVVTTPESERLTASPQY